jgi:hydroxymethylpyrimidine pyrophosphatase-like HAD family hydrolase
MNRIRLLSTDFDGTLIGHPSDGRCSPKLAEALCDYSRAGGLWAVNTGRSLPHAIEGLEQFACPVAPHFLLTNEREVFRKDETGEWCDFGNWNQICHDVHAALFSEASGIFDAIITKIPTTADVTVIHESGLPVGLITSDEGVMESVVAALAPVREEFADFSWQRNTVYLRFCHQSYHKGAALAELCRLTGISSSETMAAGDHFNDLSMLCGKYSAFVACPDNAIPIVKETVRAAGGFVSAQKFGDGIADALESLRA